MKTLRQILPRPKIIIYVLLYLAIVPLFLHVRKVLVNGASIQLRDSDQLWFFTNVIIVSIVYGGRRVINTFPTREKGYLDWLMLTPWEPQKPLPLGPVHLVWQDVLVPTFLVAATWGIGCSNRSLLWIPIAMVLAYLVPICWTFLVTDELRGISALLFGGGFVVLAWPDPNMVGLIVLVLYLINLWGQKQMWKRYPWTAKDKAKLKEPGWPFSSLAPIEIGDSSLKPWIAFSLLISWWFFVILSSIDNQPANQTVCTILLICAIFVPLLHWCMYRISCAPPISLRGRINTGTYILWGYDYVMFRHIALALTGVLFVLFMSILPISTPTNTAICIFAGMVAFFSIGPLGHVWKLTGHYHMSRGLAHKPKQKRETPRKNHPDLTLFGTSR